MKYHLVLCLIIVATRVSFNLSEVIVGTYADPSHPGKCVVMDMVLSAGTVTRHPEKCAKINCHAEGKASIVTCSAMIPPANCTLGELVNPEGNYPNCCRKKIICKNGIEFNS